MLGGQADVQGRRRHVEGPDRQRELHGRQPDEPGARHRQGRDGGGQRRPAAEAHRRSEGRDRGAGRDDQQHDRHARDVRRPGDDGGARGRASKGKLGGQAKVPGRRGHVEGPDRERQPARRQPDDAGARDRRSGHRGDAGRPHAVDHRRGAGRSRRAEGHDQRDDPQPARHDAEEHRAGLAEDQPRQVQPHAAGPEGPEHRRPPDPVRARAGRRRAARACSTCSTRAASRRGSTLLASYGVEGPERARQRSSSSAKGWSASARSRRRRSCCPTCRSTTCTISSGLGAAPPQNILVLPVIFEGQVKGVLELASFERFSPTHQAFLDQLTESIGIVINTIEANTRTEDLLTQSQSLAQELQSRQQELQQTNQELEEKAGLLAHQNQEVERKNQEVEQARKALEEKAEQLALTSKYKSEFLANMSHELRTPLNSLLILSDQLCKNPDGNLTREAGRVREDDPRVGQRSADADQRHPRPVEDRVRHGGRRSDRPAARGPARATSSARSATSPRRRTSTSSSASIRGCRSRCSPTPKRLQQVLKNLLSNAFKFTHAGQVTLTIEPVEAGWNPQNESLNRASEVIAFSVTDTGIGISPDKQQIIFEAFQQADGSTSRKYGGTGPRARDQPRAVARCSAARSGWSARRASAARSRCTCRGSTCRCAPSRKARRRAARPAFADSAAGNARSAAASRVRHAVSRSSRDGGLDRPDGRSRKPPRRMSTRSATTATIVASPATGCCSSSRTISRSRASCSTPRARRASRAIVTSHRASTALALAGRVQAGRDHARHLPARHRRLARARSAEERHRDAAHPGRGHLDRRSARPRARIRAASRVRRQADPEQGGRSTRCSSELQRVRRGARERHAAGRLAPTRRRANGWRRYLAADDIRVVAAPDSAAPRGDAARARPVDCMVLDARLPRRRRRCARRARATARRRARPRCRSSSTASGGTPGRCDGWRRLGAARRRARGPHARTVCSTRRAFFLHRDAREDARGASARAARAARQRTKCCRADGDDRRRRHAQHLRAVLAARGPRHGRRRRTTTAATRSARCRRSRTSTSC